MPIPFSSLGLHSHLLKGLDDLQLSHATAIQEKTIPIVLEQNEDLLVRAKTGSGKTAAYGLPLIQQISVEHPTIQVVILAPTRELVQQIFNNLSAFAVHLPEVSIACISGGTPIKPQIERLLEPTHIIVATPGRLQDLRQRKAIDLGDTNTLVLDEADEMLTAFKEELTDLMTGLPRTKRSLLFTATLPGNLKQLVQNQLSKNVIQIEENSEHQELPSIEHRFVIVEPIEKLDVLLHFLSMRSGQRGIIFCRTKAAVNKLAKKLAINKFSSGAIHSSLTQGIRDRIMGQFRAGFIDVLVATDLAARGIDIKDVSFIVNYHLPDSPQTYIHRTGRTARAGATGYALSIIQEDEQEDLATFEAHLSLKLKPLKKATAQDISHTKTVLWAKKIFKTKPNRSLPEELTTQIHTVFHHLTKAELIEKLLANYLSQASETENVEAKPLHKNSK